MVFSVTMGTFASTKEAGARGFIRLLSMPSQFRFCAFADSWLEDGKCGFGSGKETSAESRQSHKETMLLTGKSHLSVKALLHG